jgi:TetR/AcrR family transcriptional regulator, cholesterol catabolism regulator
METKTRILLKADELIRRFGIRAVTLDQIATTLGISKKTIYQFYEDKDALVDAVMIQEFTQSNKDCIECKLNAKDALQEIFLLMERMDKDFSNLNPLVLHDLKKFHYNTFLKFNQYMHDNMIVMIEENLARGINEGLYRANIDIKITSRFRMASVWLLFDQEIYPASKFNLVEVSRTVFELFMYGLVTTKGYKLIEKYKLNKII